MLYSGFLIKLYSECHPDTISLGDIEFNRSHLHQAIECLTSLDDGNVMADKCARYTMKLDRVLDVIRKFRLYWPSFNTPRILYQLTRNVLK